MKLLLRGLRRCSPARLSRVSLTAAVLYVGVVLLTLAGWQMRTHPEPEVSHVPTQAMDRTCEETTSWNFRFSPPHGGDGGSPLEGGERFQQINTFNAYVYSAFAEPGAKSVYDIVVLGVTDVHYPATLFCHLGDNKTKTMLKGRRELLPESHGNSTGVVSFICSYKSKIAPVVVSLTFKSTDVPTNELRIAYPKTLRRNVTTCYAVLFNYLRPLQLIQSIEMNRVLGSQHFFVYNHSVSNTTDAVLRHYQGLGLLTVMQWPLPPSDIWYHGQVLAINDCVHRNRFVSQFVVIQDTDEYIIPNHHNSFTEVMESADLETNMIKTTPANFVKQRVGTYVFESALHFAIPDLSAWRVASREFSVLQQEEDLMFKYCITAFLHLQRLDRIFTFNYRTKAIVRPELVKYAGIHFTHQHRDHATTLVVSNDLAILHHYNPHLYYTNLTIQNESTSLDSSIFRFKLQFLAKLETVFAAVGLT